jgi:hypothetical protein
MAETIRILSRATSSDDCEIRHSAYDLWDTMLYV